MTDKIDIRKNDVYLIIADFNKLKVGKWFKSVENFPNPVNSSVPNPVILLVISELNSIFKFTSHWTLQIVERAMVRLGSTWIALIKRSSRSYQSGHLSPRAFFAKIDVQRILVVTTIFFGLFLITKYLIRHCRNYPNVWMFCKCSA